MRMKDNRVNKFGSEEWMINSKPDTNNVKVFMSCQCCHLLIVGHACKCIVTLLWCSTLPIPPMACCPVFVYCLAKQVNHLLGSQNTLCALSNINRSNLPDIYV